MTLTQRTPPDRRSRIATISLIVTGLVVLSSSCGSDADVGSLDSGVSADTIEEQQSDPPASTADSVADEEQAPDASVSDAEVEDLDEQLIEAVRAGELEEVRALLDAGADVDATGSARSGSWTYTAAPAITHAVLTDHSDVLELLIAHGADLEKVEIGYRDTALHTAAHLDNSAIVRILLEHGANSQPISLHRNWETPLHYAAEVGAVEAINALLDEGADVDVQVAGRRTALMNIVKEGGTRVATEVATILLEQGADPNLQDLDGLTALHSAAARGNSDVVRLCIDHGAQVDVQDNNGDTALHLASKTNRVEVVESLIEAGASLDVTNNAGETALDLVP